MPGVSREAAGGYVYHVINRGVGRMTLFEDETDYAAVVRVMVRALAVHPIDVLAYCLMPNHWHLVLRPSRDQDHETDLLDFFSHAN